MRDRAMFGALSRQQRMAVKLRASEKRILQVLHGTECTVRTACTVPSVMWGTEFYVRGMQGSADMFVLEIML